MSDGLGEELRRRERISDMMLTAHSVLRDRFVRRAVAFDILLLTLSAILCGTTFLDPGLIKYFHLEQETIRTILGVCAILVFILSIIGLRVDWKEKSTRHRQACRALADIKAKSRELIGAPEERQAKEAPEFLRASGFVMSELTPIPDVEFVELKAKHRQKVEISRLLDTYPSALVWLLRLKLRCRDSLAVIRKDLKDRGDDSGSQ